MADVAVDLDLVKSGDVVQLAKLLTALERRGPKYLFSESQLVDPGHTAFRVGITGPPGAGKSTLIARLMKRWLDQGLKVAVLAVDPSSPFTQGAILGDRIRYHEHVLHPNLFIRSLGSRGAVGGLSASSWLMVRAFDLARFDIVLLETVGVGQTELEIMNVADEVVVVLTPESGDGIQGMKAGLMEIASQFVVNKSDRPGAESFLRELTAALELSDESTAALSPDRRPILVSALNGSGVVDLGERIERWRTEGRFVAHRSDAHRLKAEARALLMAQFELDVRQQLVAVQSVHDLANLFRSR